MKRPMCWLCLLFLAGIALGDLTGIMPVRQKPGAQSEGELSGGNGQAVIYGRIYQYNYSENSMGIWLKDVFLESQIHKNSANQAKNQQKPIEDVLVYMQEECESIWPLGAWVRVRGKLKSIDGPRNPGEFDSRLYYQTKKIHYRMSGRDLLLCQEQTWRFREGMRQMRERLSRSLEEAAPEHAGILCAMVTGEKRLLGQEEKNLLAKGSLSHMISISGMHLGLLGMLTFGLLQRLGLGIRPAAVLAVTAMTFYGMLTGESVATMRALGMFGLAMAAKAAGRSYDLLSALALSAILVLLDNPVYLYYSGFLLSCGCICGAGLILPQLEKAFFVSKEKTKPFRAFQGALQMGIAVQAATLPLSVWFYYEIPLYGILVNLLAVPTLAVVLASGVLGAAVGMWRTSLAKIILLPGCLLLDFYKFLCGIAGKLPFGVLIVGRPKMWQALLYYVFLAVGILALRCVNSGKCRACSLRRRRVLSKGHGASRRFLSGGLFLFFWLAGTILLCVRGRKELEITCLDVGQGDGAVVCSPKGECYLVDGGSSSQGKVGQYRILPFLKSQGISQVDAAFVSHTDADHINGLEEIFELIRTGQTSLKIQCLVMPRLEKEDPAQKKLAALARRAGAAVRYMRAGDQAAGNGICWRALSPAARGQTGDVNEDSLTLLLEYGGFQGMFTGDIGETQEAKMAAVLTDCDFLKVAHHGSRYSTKEPFLKKVRPEIAVASSSATNTYGHPHPDTLQRLEKNKCHVFLTKDSGAVTLKVRDKRMQAEAYLQK